MSKEAKNKNSIVIYQGENGEVELRADIQKDTIWATQAQIADLFGVNSQAITKHLLNIYKEVELSKDSTCSKMEQVQSEGGRAVKRKIEFYNLDAIIAVGYRVNSKKATQFRIWATGVLREYLKHGYALQRSKLQRSRESLEGLNETLALIESEKYPGKLKGKMTLKITKNLEPRRDNPAK